MKVQLRRNYAGFVPYDEYDADQLESVKVGEVICAEVSQPRNPKFHRLAFGMLWKLYQNQDRFTDFDKLRAYLQIKAGIVDMIMPVDGKPYYVVKSLAWDKMDEMEFEKTFQALLTAAYEEGWEWVLEQYA